MAQKVVFLTTVGAGTYTIPNDFGSLVSVEAIGGGGNGFAGTSVAGGGGGGAYAKSTLMTGLGANVPVYYQVGIGGGTGGTGDSWFSLTNSAPAAGTNVTNGVLSKGGTSATSGTGGAGGDYTLGAGDLNTRYSGGAGGNSSSGKALGGGGGAGGLGGTGGAGGAGQAAASGVGGGGGSGSTSSLAGGTGAGGATGGAGGAVTGQTGGTGGTGGTGTNGGGGGGANSTTRQGGAGGTSTYWTQTSDSTTAGPGGGGGGGSAGSADSITLARGGAGGLYGGGGGGTGSGSGVGLGAQGIIVFTYNATTPSVGPGRLPGNSGYKFPILNSNASASSTVVDFDDMFVQKELFLDAGLYGWGSGAFGSLGNGNTTNYSSPIQIGSLTNWKQVFMSQNHSLAIKTDGSLWSWGLNTFGDLGDGTVVNKSSPVQIGSLYNWKSISGCTNASGDTSAAIKTDGTLWMWGANFNGLIPIGGTVNNYYSSPIQIGALTNWKQVSINVNCAFGYAIKTDGTLWTWGSGDSGSLGLGAVGGVYSSPVQIGALTNWKYITNGQAWAFALKTDGTIWGWGANSAMPLSYSSPVQIGSLTNWKQIAACLYHGGAIKTDGTLWMFGNNTYGQLGDGTTTNKNSPVQIGTLTNWKQLSIGFNFTTAIKTDGTLWAWGWNNFGQLGQNYRSDTVYYSSPIQVGALTNWKSVASGTYNTSAISSPDLP
jgi:alpha-tubulin suppressor-like RCC1 family protein